MNPTSYPKSANAELAYPGLLAGSENTQAVRRVQEWLSLHDFGTAIDGRFGTATAHAVSGFQKAHNLAVTGAVDQATWDTLTSPMRSALENGGGADLSQRVRQIASQHLAARAREVGGDNRGPWVRLYTGGHEGAEWKWCGGFVTFVLMQATSELQIKMPVAGSLSCDSLAAQGAKAHLLRSDEEVGARAWKSLGSAFIFLVRRTGSDWSHTGFGFEGSSEHFATIEGNTNDDGSANGYEVAARVRSAKDKDFIIIQ